MHRSRSANKVAKVKVGVSSETTETQNLLTFHLRGGGAKSANFSFSGGGGCHWLSFQRGVLCEIWTQSRCCVTDTHVETGNANDGIRGFTLVKTKTSSNKILPPVSTEPLDLWFQQSPFSTKLYVYSLHKTFKHSYCCIAWRLNITFHSRNDTKSVWNWW